MLPPLRGDVWRVDLEPIRGHEQGGKRPALILSSNIINRGPTGLVTVVPITTRDRPIRAFLRIEPPEGGLKQVSFIICNQVRTISRDRLDRRFGSASAATLAEVERRVRFLLEFR